MTEYLQHLSLWWLWLAAVAAGVVSGGLCAAVSCLVDWARRRRT